MSKKLGVVITDGVGFRNFVLSNFTTEATDSFDEVVILSCLPKEVYTDHTSIRVIELAVFQEPFKTWFFRKAKEIAHLQLFKKDNFGIADNLRANRATRWSPRGIATRFVYAVTRFLHSENWIQRYERWQQSTFANHPVTLGYAEILKEEKVDALFFTHQRPAFIAPLAVLGQKMKIPTIAFIFSWDNLASKGRMASSFDKYLVWSELMQTELLHFYTKVNADAVAVVGTPQFEPYVLARYASDKERFYKKFDLDSKKKTLCFSCGDISTSRNDELYIETIAEAIKTGAIADVNLLIRTSPAEDPVRFQSFVAKYPFIKWNYPDWKVSRNNHQEAWSQRVPGVDDVVDLRAILAYSDVNINMLSTMSLDFMQFGKPVINPVFGNVENGLYNDQRFLNYVHINYVVESGATRVVKQKNKLIAAIQAYLENPLLDAKQREALVKLQVGKPLKGTGKRIAKTLAQWVQ